MKEAPPEGDEEGKKAQAWLSKLEEQLLNLETDRIVKGMTAHDLTQKGFVGDKAVAIGQTRFKEVSEKEKLEFEPGIEPFRLPESDRFDDLEIGKIDHQKDVPVGQLIAKRRVDESVPFKEGRNVRRELRDGIEYYFSAFKGKVVIHRECLHVFPSDIHGAFKIRVASDKMKAFLDCTPAHGEGREIDALEVMVELRKTGVVHGIDGQALKKAADTANRLRARQENVEIAAGTAPKSGGHGQIEYKFNTDPKRQEFKVLPDGRVDYKSMSHIILSEKGKLLAEIIPAGAGVPGRDVLGQSIPAEPGREASLLAGRGVRKDAEGRRFFADLDGSVVLNGGVLEVMSLYVVNGDVDYSTGNIHFNGTVIINGNVIEGFEVRADGDIIVKKNVEGARLWAGRDAEIHGGIQGKGKGLVSAGRDLRAGFAQNAKLEAQGNIYIANFAVNSLIYTSKFLKMQDKRGALIGGEAIAQRGIDVKILGSEGGTRTAVEVGSDFLIQRKLSELDQAIGFCEQNAKKIEETLRQVSVLFKANPSLMAEKGSLVQKTLDKRKELLEQKAIMSVRREALAEELHEREACFAKVSGTCFADVFIKIREFKTTVTRPRDNVRFYADAKAGEIKTAPY